MTFIGSKATQTGTSATPSYLAVNPTGANFLIFGITIRSTRTITVPPVFNAGPAIQIGATSGTTGVTNSMWGVLNPFQGSSTIDFTQSASDNYAIGAMWFNLISPNGIPDATSTTGATTTTSFSTSVTSLIDNCIAVSWGDANGGAALTGGANTTVVNQPEVAFTGAYLIYSTAPKSPAGTFTLNVTSSSQTFSACMASFAPLYSQLSTLNAG